MSIITSVLASSLPSLFLYFPYRSAPYVLDKTFFSWNFSTLNTRQPTQLPSEMTSPIQTYLAPLSLTHISLNIFSNFFTHKLTFVHIHITTSTSMWFVQVTFFSIYTTSHTFMFLCTNVHVPTFIQPRYSLPLSHLTSILSKHFHTHSLLTINSKPFLYNFFLDFIQIHISSHTFLFQQTCYSF